MSLIDLLPEDYKKSNQVINYQDAFEYQTEKLKYAKASLFEQLFVETATWGLVAWEKAYDIKTDLSASYEIRRERIKAKMRGTGTVTKQMIKDTAAAFTNGEVEVIEDPANSSFIIKFVGSIGIPANMDGLITTIEEIKPAHLSYTIEYTFRRYEELVGYTHQQLSAFTHKQIREEVI